ncbi:MAG: TolC family protein, partial [Ignavibacteriales bacterium]|nr:TolC family protein [Ignavibacteriales bacterium]MCF8438677.1 TolC family protein [Ignavibacteriales bacterium]
AGLIANHNLMRAKVALAEAEKNMKAAENDYLIAKLLLTSVMGVDESQIENPTDSLVYFDAVVSAENYLQKAQKNNPVINILDLKKNSARQKFNIERSKLLPQIAAFGKYEIYQKDLSMLEPEWTIGLSLTMNIFNGFQDYDDIKSTEHLINEIGYMEIDTRKNINLMISKLYADIANYREQIILQEEIIKHTKDNLEQNMRRFDTGLGSSLEVVDARLLVEKSMLDSKTAIYYYFESLNSFLNTAGASDEFTQIWDKNEN